MIEFTQATAEIDDEAVTEEERRDIKASREWFKHNEGIPFEQAVAELSLSMEKVAGSIFRREPAAAATWPA